VAELSCFLGSNNINNETIKIDLITDINTVLRYHWGSKHHWGYTDITDGLQIQVGLWVAFKCV
jgi:hypothetical protein